jgi:hypothetical protein
MRHGQVRRFRRNHQELNPTGGKFAETTGSFCFCYLTFQSFAKCLQPSKKAVCYPFNFSRPSYNVSMSNLPYGSANRQSADRCLKVIQGTSKLFSSVSLDGRPEIVEALHDFFVARSPAAQEFQREYVRMGPWRSAGFDQVDVVDDKRSQADIEKVILRSSETGVNGASHKSGIKCPLFLNSMERCR